MILPAFGSSKVQMAEVIVRSGVCGKCRTLSGIFLYPGLSKADDYDILFLFCRTVITCITAFSPSMTTGFSTKSYVFDPRPSYPLLSVVKRYWKPDSPYLHDPQALTLVFAHGTSFHKEQWEPTIDDLQAIVEKHAGGTGTVKVREIWTIDAPNHGDAAELNAEMLKLGYEGVFGWEEYARSLHLFLSGLGTGVDVDFTGHNLVGVGHSMGAVSLALTLGYYPKINFKAFILCEVMIMPRKFGAAATEFLSGGAAKRRDIWPSKEEAYKILKARGTWKTWDDRVLRSYVEYGMRDLPTGDYPDKQGVTLKCSRYQETATYRDPIGSQRVFANFGNIIKQVPTHLIYGAIDDYIAAEIKTHVVETLAGGAYNLGSVARVPGAGHLVVQMNPTGLAEKIYDALIIIGKKPRTKQEPRANL